jgi:hypothetical protein
MVTAPKPKAMLSSRIKSEHRELPGLLSRIKSEYHEMPGLCVTFSQACRLWHLDRDTCHDVLKQLVHDHFLRQTPKGLFVRAS